MKNIGSLIVLIISCLFLIILAILLKTKKKTKSQVKSIFIILLIMMVIWTMSLILQILFQDSNIDPVFFEGIAAFGACFVPVTFMLFGIIFAKTKIKIKPSIIFLYIIPILSTILMITNGKHQLMYKYYSIYSKEAVFGSYFFVHAIYSYVCIFIGLLYLIIYMIKNSGFFSKQSLLIFTGVSISLTINILATFGILNLTVYATPISFTIAFLFFAFAIFKFDFLKVAPIALQKIVDRMSDAYLIVNDENVITDFNQTFLNLFSVTSAQIRNQNISHLFDKYNKHFGIKEDLIMNAINNSKNNSDTIILEEPLPSIKKYFHIEINSIRNNNAYLGTLILLKDVTQHTLDMQELKDNQDLLIEKERLASLGQMIGGIAHNLKTPIMSIAGAAEGLSDLINEYDEGIEDPDLTPKDHHDIASDMKVWIEKIRGHLSYMSDIITAIKGQAVAFEDQTTTDFTINELIKMVNILMQHELKSALIDLNVNIEVDENMVVKGNINSLVQVVNNIISNAIQAYTSQGKSDEKILLNISNNNNNLLITIQDNAGGLPKNVQEKLFKEMITTKGKNGTGLGLFMSCSNIKAHFGGTLTYKTEEGKGTTFIIEIPMNK